LDKVKDIWSKDVAAKGRDIEYQVMLKRDLTDQESLLRTFGTDTSSTDSDAAAEQSDEPIELDLKTKFFYVVNPEGRIIDCAKIYSFLHEDNIY